LPPVAPPFSGGPAVGRRAPEEAAPPASPRRDPPPQSHHALLTLGEERADAERARDFVGDEDAADRGSQDGLSARADERRGQRLTEPRRMLRVLEDERRLQIDVGV